MSGLPIGYARVSSDAQDLTARDAAAAGDDPDVLRMGNLGTDIPPSEEAMEATRAASLFTVSPDEEGDMMAKAAAGGGGADSSVADQLRALGMKGVLVQMAERGQLLALKCEMPQGYHHKGRGAFDPVTTPRTKWAPSPDHYPIPKSAGGHLVPENVRLAHIWCDSRDYGWRTQIRTLLAKGKSLAEIADALNSKGVPPAHGMNRWTAAMVRKAYVSWAGRRNSRAADLPMSGDPVAKSLPPKRGGPIFVAFGSPLCCSLKQMSWHGSA